MDRLESAPDCHPTLHAARRLRVMQLASASLPVGAFAYSQGLEALVEEGGIRDAQAAATALCGLAMETLGWLELPILSRIHRALRREEQEDAQRWSQVLLAYRETRELREQEAQMARSYLRILPALGVKPPTLSPRTACEAFAICAVALEIDEQLALEGWAYSWCEQHCSALARLLALGPLASAGLLSSTIDSAARAVPWSLVVTDEQLGASAPSLADASARHELYDNRVFRS